MALYWEELPFIRADDLPKERVARAIVVDTQTVQSIRGLDAATEISIIDHHDARPSLDPSWRVTLERTGATTTVLVEQIRARTLPLTPIQATTLLLGIYEDTGALTYSSTTPRDSYAAAWLLEQGALLDVVQDFLHHNLGDDQLALLERLQEGAETHVIEGHPVVIACSSAPDLVEEIATLAHRLRDLLDPAAVFLLVDLGHHIQLVARSTVDALDVGRVAEHFGGGGHGRAAAAIIRDMSLPEARSLLLSILPRIVRPALTVADLMSHGVQTLSPNQRVSEASNRMRRYGHEGFPVVDDGRVVGLLTRRAVDRALGHGLKGVRVAQFMEAGQVTVRPGDSITTVQQTMMTSGWGQVPVVDDKGHILGVVTRTDLIKHMGHGGPPLSRRAEIASILDEHLPPLLVALMREAGRLAQEVGAPLYMVGGGVRDLLLGQPTTDLDFVLEGDAIALTRTLHDRFGGDTRSHPRFRTGTWLLGPDTWQAIGGELGIPSAAPDGALPAHIDFASARTEFYEAPTVLPEVERSSIKLDLHRRDFTINTLAIRLDPNNFGLLLDFYGGEADLRDGRIRVLHSLSFIDDPTRILRAVRFEQRLGFQIEARTAQLIGHAISLLDRVSGDRLKHEFELILDEDLPEQVFCRLDQLGVLQAIHPDLSCGPWTCAAFRALRYAASLPLWPALSTGFDSEVPYFALLTHSMPRESMHALCSRLKVRRSTVEMLDTVHDLCAESATLSGPATPSTLVRLLDRAGDDVLATLWAAAPDADMRDSILAYVLRLRTVSPVATGNTLKARGLRPGPAYRAILDRLRDAWLDGEVTTPDEEQALLDSLLAAALSVEEAT
jgi:tRNA nucleotidyltransferase (CCA-adding enzyme)